MEVHKQFDIEREERGSSKQVRARTKQSKNLDNIECIRSEDNTLLVRGDATKECERNFHKLYNEHPRRRT